MGKNMLFEASDWTSLSWLAAGSKSGGRVNGFLVKHHGFGVQPWGAPEAAAQMGIFYQTHTLHNVKGFKNPSKGVKTLSVSGASENHMSKKTSPSGSK